ncbi:hypothetical protein G3I40_40695 [Streptomyces sp. SID14478]|nr:glycoside hydrolase family 3 N-terminal domain-containing protein [Streptomyces sp. SID14478]NEB81487.1 hypothetical protein [Streptomyces sp. SID14478]
MTLREKAGQMNQVSTATIKDKPQDLATYGVGSVLSAVGGSPTGTGGTAAQWADMVDGYQRQALKNRLGIPLLHGVDAVHGHNMVQGTTLFPQHIGMGATRDPDLVRRAEDITRQEVLGTGIRWAFAPCVCVPRDDRWGRTYEGYGEDPSIVSPLGAAAVRGLQGPRPGKDEVMATAKHFVGDGGTTFGTGDNGYLIDRGDSRMSEADLRKVHLPAFRAAVDAGVGSVMVTYSSWNGKKVHGDRYLITDVLKKELGFHGIVISDFAGVREIKGSGYADQVVRAVDAGIDMIMDPSRYKATIDAIVQGVRDGRIPSSRVDDAVRRILDAKFSLDLFKHPYADRGYAKNIGSPAHRAVAREAVRRSQVLLKNEGGALPLPRTGTYKIAVGGDADDLGLQLGGWSVSWQGHKGRTTTGTTLWQALRKTTAGTGISVRNVGAATSGDYSADVGIWVGGERPYAEGHGDSADLALGGDNARQLSALCARVKVCVAVLYSGRPLIITDQLPEVDAFVASWLPGTEAEGITDALFGKGFSGRLPVSWPKAVADEPINAGDGKKALFPQGYGISPY